MGPCDLAHGKEDDLPVRLIILQNNERSRAALKIGHIGPYVNPDAQVYHTIGTSGKLAVYNHLGFPIYAAVGGFGMNGAYKIEPNKLVVWNRQTAPNGSVGVHISVAGCIESQKSFMFAGYVGKVLHVQNLPVEKEWKGQ